MSQRHFILEQGHQRLVRAKHGYVLYNRNDTVIGRLIETYGEYFESEVDVFRRFLSPGDLALDVGANIGIHTLALASIVGRGGFVYSFEPQRLVFQTLCANVALNSLDNVHCVNAAVAESAGWLEITDPDPESANNFGGAQVNQLTGTVHGQRVLRIAVDDFLDVDRLKLIKMDVEGMEAEALRGARRTIQKHNPVLYVENAFPDKSPELLGLLAEMEYECFWHLPLYVSRQNYSGNGELIYPVGFVDRGEEFLDCIGIAVNILCVPVSSGIKIEGLRAVETPGEHPLRRDSVQLFSASDGGPGIPILPRHP